MALRLLIDDDRRLIGSNGCRFPFHMKHVQLDINKRMELDPFQMAGEFFFGRLALTGAFGDSELGVKIVHKCMKVREGLSPRLALIFEQLWIEAQDITTLTDY